MGPQLLEVFLLACEPKCADEAEVHPRWQLAVEDVAGQNILTVLELSISLGGEWTHEQLVEHELWVHDG